VHFSTTHFHVDIDCHVNPTGPTTTFGTQNESRHFEWRDSSISHATPFGVTNFGPRFPYYLPFSITKNK
jgi:hypothetical protein